MLQYLKIKNFALLDEVTLEFDPGFTAITGETGAGKSILLGALSLLAGSRTDKSIIRQGTSHCEVQAELHWANPARINSILQSLNLPPCEDNTLILYRSIHREKSPRILINGSLAPLTALQQLGEYWIDFHGPGESQKLFHLHHQLQMLDLYAGLSPILKDYSDLFSSWKALLKQTLDLSQKEQLSPDELAFYQSQIDKITAVNPSEASIAELEENWALISNAQTIATLTAQLETTFNNDSGIIPSLQSLLRPTQELSKILPTSLPLTERLNSLIIEAEDLANEFTSLNQNLNTHPEFIEKTQQQMNNWLEINRQYGPSIQNVLNKLKTLKEKIASQTNIESTLQQLETEAAAKQASLEKIANTLTQKRSKAAASLSQKTQTLLQSLGFQKAKLEIKISPENTLTPHGNSTAEFLFSPNAGQPLMPLNKIASSGETARVMLALKTILAEVDQTPLLVFDEADANVGGEIASQVAQKLKQLSQNHQILCVTHLPQTAAQAHHHYVVNKTLTPNTTTITLSKLSTPQTRTQELARMLGNRSSQSALNHATELLSQPAS